MPIGGGGPFVDAADNGRGTPVLDTFRRCETEGFSGAFGMSGTTRPGNAGAAPTGGRGAEGRLGGWPSSDKYEASWEAARAC